MLRRLQQAASRFDRKWMIQFPHLWSASETLALLMCFVTVVFAGSIYLLTATTTVPNGIFPANEVLLSLPLLALLGMMLGYVLLIPGALLCVALGFRGRFDAPGDEAIARARIEVWVGRLIGGTLIILAALQPGLMIELLNVKQSSLVSDAALVADVTAVNGGLAACCVVAPGAESCSLARPIPMSSIEIEQMRSWKLASFLDPRILIVQRPADPHGAAAGMASVILRYWKPNPNDKKERGLHASSGADRARVSEQICWGLDHDVIGAIDLRISQILAAKRVAARSHERIADIVIDGLLLATLFVVLGFSTLWGGAVAGTGAFLVVNALAFVLPFTLKVRLEGWLWLIWLAAMALGIRACVAKRHPVYALSNTLAVFVVYIACVSAWSDNQLFAVAVDRAIVVLGIVTAVFQSRSLRRAVAHAEASPR